MKKKTLILFTGPSTAGKTTFVKGIAKEMGIKEKQLLFNY